LGYQNGQDFFLGGKEPGKRLFQRFIVD